MAQVRQSSRRVTALAALLTVGVVIALGQTNASATHRTVTAVKGSAYGYWATGISLGGGPQPDQGPNPTVTLATDASNSPQSASVPSATVQYGPATLLTSDGITVSSTGSLGTTGAVHSTSSLTNLNKSTFNPTITGSEILTADDLTATADATGESAATAATSITNGFYAVHSNSSNCGTATTVCGRPGDTYVPPHTHPDLTNPEGLTAVPANPAPNTKVAGHVHLSATSIDYYVIVFNEQTVNPDGSITVVGAHEYLGYKLVNGQIVEDLPNSKGGSVIHGHLYLGQAVAGVTSIASPTTTTTQAPTTTTTQAPTTTTTTAPTGVPDLDVDIGDLQDRSALDRRSTTTSRCPTAGRPRPRTSPSSSVSTVRGTSSLAAPV